MRIVAQYGDITLGVDVTGWFIVVALLIAVLAVLHTPTGKAAVSAARGRLRSAREYVRQSLTASGRERRAQVARRTDVAPPTAESTLYAALVALCRDYGFTNEETYDRLHDAIATITPADETQSR